MTPSATSNPLFMLSGLTLVFALGVVAATLPVIGWSGLAILGLMCFLTALLAVDLWSLRGRAVRSDQDQRRARAALAFGVVLVVLAAAMDPWGLLSGSENSRFLLVALVFGITYALGRFAHQLPGPAMIHDRFLLVFVLYVLMGAFIGRFALGTEASLLSVAVVLLVAVVPVGGGPIYARPVLRALVVSLIAFLCAEVVFFAYPGHPEWVSPAAYGHGLATLLVGAILGCVLLRWWLALVPVAGMAAYVFLAYPAATYILVAGAAVGTLCITSRRQILSQAASIGAMVVGVILVLVVFDPNLVTGVTRHYYEQVGKTNNDHVRVAFDYEALSRLRESPLFGSFFTGEATVSVPQGTTIVVNGRVMEQLPPHNDFLQVGMLGGCFALILLIGWLIGLNRAVIRWTRLHSAEDRMLARLLLVIINGFMATSLVEPVLTIASSALIFAASLIALKVCLSQEVSLDVQSDQSLPPPALSGGTGVSSKDEGRVTRP